MFHIAPASGVHLVGTMALSFAAFGFDGKYGFAVRAATKGQQ
jgi:hypothetical protein